MTRHRIRTAVIGALSLATLAACGGSHGTVIAKAGSQELSIDRLATLMGNAPQIQIQGPQGREVAKNLTNLWVDYQLLGLASAKGDSLNDAKTVDDAMWAIIAMERSRMLVGRAISTTSIDTSNGAARYASGDYLSARHILIPFPRSQNGLSKPLVDSLRRVADALRAQVSVANFAELAQKNSGDQASAPRGGDLGIFPKGVMAGPFAQALVALQPGQISQVVATPYGLHIIYRPTYAEVAPKLGAAILQRGRMVAESTYLAGVEQAGNLVVKSDAPLWAKSIAQDIDAHRKDDKVLATSTAGNLTAARVGEWISSMPQSPQLRAQVQQSPDSGLKLFVRQLARNELLIKTADSAKIVVDTAVMGNLRRAFIAAVDTSWSGLGVSPASLSAGSSADREKLAAQRVEAYLDGLTAQRVPFINMPSPVERALRAKYSYTIDDATLDGVLERAAAVRATRDSTKSAAQPATAVPLPGGATKTP